MELLLILVGLFLLRFLLSWVKVYFFMWSADIKGSSFKRTFAYMIGKSELKDINGK